MRAVTWPLHTGFLGRVLCSSGWSLTFWIFSNIFLFLMMSVLPDSSIFTLAFCGYYLHDICDGLFCLLDALGRREARSEIACIRLAGMPLGAFS